MSVATWYDWEDGLILVNMHESRSRLRWLRANPKASLTALGEGGAQGGASGAGSARPDAPRGDVPPQIAWSAHEVLAHIVVLSKFYGVIFHKVSSGKMTELDLLNNVGLRDAMDEKMAQIEPKELIRMALEDHARTIKGLRAADAASMRRVVKVDGGETMTAEEVARLPLISHLELHIDQLARALA